MKRCPQCNSVFDDSLVFCTNDGTPLTEEKFVLPSEASEFDEEPTVVRSEPITIKVAETNAPTTEQFDYQTTQPPVAETIVIEKRRGTGKYLLFLVVGLVLGGGLVLAAVLAAMYLTQNRTTVSNAGNQNQAPAPAKTKTPAPTATPVTASAKHAEPTADTDDEFNGRVISINAYVRLLPNRESPQVDVLPTGDRLKIIERAGENSPWFYVNCEHGTSGWMHGNTIEYTQ